MGLDLIISEQSDFRTDEKGRNIYTVTQLANFRNCHTILNSLDYRLDGGFSNCSTHSFTDVTFQKILEELKEKRQALLDGKAYRFPSDTDERFNTRVKEEINQLNYEIEKLETFIAQEELISIDEDTTEDEGERTFEVHAWW